MKDYSLYYCDQRLEEAEVVELLKQAWDELYELEFDQVFGTWRGVHLEPETDTVHITWENMYGAPLDDLHSPGHPGPQKGLPPGRIYRTGTGRNRAPPQPAAEAEIRSRIRGWRTTITSLSLIRFSLPSAWIKMEA